MADYDEIKGSLEQLSKRDLERLQKEVDKALRTADERARREARQQAEEAAKAHGFSLAELLDGGSGKGRKRAANPPKFQHPENPEQTWSGRGRQPKWVKDHVKNGGDMDDLLIQPNAG